MRYGILILAVIIVATLAPASALAASTMVEIKSNQFSPQEITISPGDTVTWTNRDPVKHDVSFDSFTSPLLSQGETYSHTFDQPGTYEYNCNVHPFMKGQVVVR